LYYCVSIADRFQFAGIVTKYAYAKLITIKQALELPSGIRG